MNRAIVLAALACGALTAAAILSSDHLDSKEVWAVFGPIVGWSFVGTGLYARQKRPESRTGTLMVWLGFAWFGNAIATINSPSRTRSGRSPAGCGAACSCTS